MKSRLFSLGIVGVVAACFLAPSAHAYNAGITDYSGKTANKTCMSAGCHSSNPSTIPTEVTLLGPDSLVAGATGNYTLVIKGGPANKAGMNVAVSNGGGTLTPGGTDLQAISNELTHKGGAKAFANGEVRFDFSLVAPTSAQTVTLYASGNSVNGNSQNTGDNAASITKAIQVTGGSTGTPDAGTGNPDAGSGGGDGDEDDDDGGGCSAAGGAPMVLLLALVAAHMRRRRD
ncbi:MXAN_6652 family MXYO-CTERM-anchored protein [Hyalangium rubrum]|uniref:MXAN_6652 family MXYO-CTERM-anchored protein n=1 Tax=Hyalangium rubrum TaxID=3103134 RepID=A0ABU5H2G5_9BACT|nr:MXAN_6652 family MXYO-CTERM-anchored protein [Hyalangium sp. s54d21]MDY7227646.1 MXAN_6652 family MXYO-CTERM-anchored protein [Hyalangium sp. s54d21]